MESLISEQRMREQQSNGAEQIAVFFFHFTFGLSQSKKQILFQTSERFLLELELNQLQSQLNSNWPRANVFIMWDPEEQECGPNMSL